MVKGPCQLLRNVSFREGSAVAEIIIYRVHAVGRYLYIGPGHCMVLGQ